MWQHIFLGIRVCRSICQDGLFLALSICKTRLIWSVSKGSPSSNILGLYKLMFIYLTGLLFFPRAGEAGLAVGPGSNCKGEQCVLRAQCPSSTPSPFCAHAGLSPPPLPPGPGFFSCPLAQSSRRSHRADWCSPGRGGDLG